MSPALVGGEVNSYFKSSVFFIGKSVLCYLLVHWSRNIIINNIFTVNIILSLCVSLPPTFSSPSLFFSPYSDLPNAFSTQLILTLCSWTSNIPELGIREKEQNLIFFSPKDKRNKVLWQGREESKLNNLSKKRKACPSAYREVASSLSLCWLVDTLLY